MSFLLSAVGILVVFGVVIFVHEFGHFIVAKKMGVKVERFSFGLGPELFGFQWGETRYCLAWIPLGGEVRMAGEMDYEAEKTGEPKKERDPRDFFAQPWYRRIPIVVAGPAMNYVLAFFIFAFIALVWGDPKISDKPIVGDLMKGYPAQAAGIERGDEFIKINNVAVSSWEEMAKTIHQYPDIAIPVSVKRGEEILELSVTPRKNAGSQKGLIGISPSIENVKMDPFRAVMRGFQQPVFLSVFTVKYLYEKIITREKPDLAGPLGIANIVAKATKSGMMDFLYLIGLISVGIGLFNLFPIPLLDGGHMAFYIWEAIFRKPLSQKAMNAANSVGLSFLLGILFLATYNDIQRMRGPKEKKDAQAVEQKAVPSPEKK